MRTIIQIINQEYGKEALAIFRKWENLNMKMCNDENHRRFSLRCLGNGIIPVSIRLKNHVRTQRSDNIIHKAERCLLNERIREVNMTLNKLKHDTYMYQNKLSAIISEDLIKQSTEFIKEHREARHKTVMALVVIDKKDYILKINQLLEDRNTYRLLKMDPTNKDKNRLVNILRRIKSEGRLEEGTYKKMYPTGASSPKLYGLPKIHKKDIPLRPIVSS